MFKCSNLTRSVMCVTVRVGRVLIGWEVDNRRELSRLRKLVLAILLSLLLTGCAGSNTPQAADNSERGCASCHDAVVQRFEASAHGQGGVTCADCHGNLDAHLKLAGTLPATDVRGETCAACHSDEYTQWAASPHAKIPLDQLPGDPRIMQCMKCHQASGFAAVINSGQDFKSSWGPAPESEPEPVTCIACHSPHKSRDTQLLRLPKGELCATCHGGKWQNQVMHAVVADAYIPPGEHKFGQAPPPKGPALEKDYSAFADHRHSGGAGCVTCHMAQTPGVGSLGGHTFSMRAKDGGPQNIGACAACHGDVTSYDINGRQTEVREALTSLEQALKDRNNGAFPGNQPGTCNSCHKGGSLPFENDPDHILANAYEVYKQIDRDKSLGVHNPGFALQVLRDALESILTQSKR